MALVLSITYVSQDLSMCIPLHKILKNLLSITLSTN